MAEMNDRIKLAEAMYETEENSIVVGKNGELMWLTDKDGKAICETIRPIPDPENDANDDYAVLEWMRKSGPSEERISFFGLLMKKTQREYQLGDYARAALKVLKDE